MTAADHEQAVLDAQQTLNDKIASFNESLEDVQQAYNQLQQEVTTYRKCLKRRGEDIEDPELDLPDALDDVELDMPSLDD